MKIDPDCLHSLRQKKGLTRPQLATRSGVTVRTIQRLENEPKRCKKTHEHTLNNLAKALGVEPGVLTGELPPPQSDMEPAPGPERVQIGAKIAPKARLAYELIKCRYGVSATEIINMAPLFFTLLAEGSLAWRREKLEEADEVISGLWEIDGFWRGSVGSGETVMGEGMVAEEESIGKADLFGEHLFSDDFHWMDYAIDPSTDNPFASYLRKLTKDLESPGFVDVEDGDLDAGSSLKFPVYDICREVLDRIVNGSVDAKMALETGYVRISEIPEKLMAEDAREERAQWLKDKLPGILKKMSDKDRKEFGEYMAKDPSDKLKNILEEVDSPKTDSADEEGGENQ